MATERMTMRKIREVLRLRWQLGLTVREAARSLGVSLGVVSKMGARATTAGLTWEVVEGLDGIGSGQSVDVAHEPTPIMSRSRMSPSRMRVFAVPTGRSSKVATSVCV